MLNSKPDPVRAYSPVETTRENLKEVDRIHTLRVSIVEYL
jgi:hypothetical protein